MSTKKLAIVGCGKLGTILAHACRDGLLPDYTLVAVMGRTSARAQALAQECHCAACDTLPALLALQPDYVAEAASAETVRTIGEAVLAAGADLILLSIGALADEAFYTRLRDTAQAHGSHVRLASGAVGGFDVLRTITLMSRLPGATPLTAGIHGQKGPASLQNTPLFQPSLLQAEAAIDVFTGNAQEAIQVLPTKVNVAVATALATAGPGNTQVTITSVPGMTGDDHCITAETDGLRATIDIYSRNSEIAAWSVVSLLQNLASPIVF